MFNTLYGKREKIVSVPVGESKTLQSFRDESDVNNIMRRYKKTGILIPESVQRRQAFYGDFVERGFDFQQAQNALLAANETFMSLSAELRYRFHNNPLEYIRFIENPANRDECIKLGFRTEKIPSTDDQIIAHLKTIAEQGHVTLKPDEYPHPDGQKYRQKTDVSGVPEPPKTGKK